MTVERWFPWWHHFINTTRILQGFAFLHKLGLLSLKPHWDYQIKTWKKKQDSTCALFKYADNTNIVAPVWKGGRDTSSGLCTYQCKAGGGGVWVCNVFLRQSLFGAVDPADRVFELRSSWSLDNPKSHGPLVVALKPKQGRDPKTWTLHSKPSCRDVKPQIPNPRP